jgi:hypothetical protein
MNKIIVALFITTLMNTDALAAKNWLNNTEIARCNYIIRAFSDNKNGFCYPFQYQDLYSKTYMQTNIEELYLKKETCVIKISVIVMENMCNSLMYIFIIGILISSMIKQHY